MSILLDVTTAVTDTLANSVTNAVANTETDGLGSTFWLISIAVFIIIGIVAYSWAKNSFEYNIYNWGNIGFISAGVIAMIVIMFVRQNADDPMQTFIYMGIAMSISTIIVFIRTLLNTSIIIALIAIVPQVVFSIIVLIIVKMILNKLFNMANDDY